MSKKSISPAITSFEDHMRQLEAIVDALDKGTATLEETVCLFAQGQQLVASCKQALADAEQRISVVKEDSDNISLMPLVDIESET